jgi:hypothetical protein
MRTTIGQERLSNLALLSIESELRENLDFSDLINSLSWRQKKVDFV